MQVPEKHVIKHINKVHVPGGYLPTSDGLKKQPVEFSSATLWSRLAFSIRQNPPPPPPPLTPPAHWKSLQIGNRLAEIKPERLASTLVFASLSQRCDQAEEFKAQLPDTEGTSPSVPAGDGSSNTRPAVRRSFWWPCEATSLRGCRPAVRWCNNPLPSQKGRCRLGSSGAGDTPVK